MKKRLIDIYPPHTRNTTSTKEEEAQISGGEKISRSREQKSSRIVVIITLLMLLFVIPPISLHLFFAEAIIQVWPQITKLHVEEQMSAQVGYDKVDLEKKIIRAHVFEGEKELTQLFPSSGKKFKEEKARGTLRVYNKSSAQAQSLVVNTRFISEDGKLFRLERAGSVPAGGFLDVQVIAAEPGPEYNIGPSNFSLPGLVGSPVYTKIYGESSGAMSGGAKREVEVVTEEDIAAAKNQLVEILKTQTAQSLLAQIPPQFQVLENSLGSTILEDSSLVKPGAELPHFNYTAKVKVSMSSFNKEDADLLALHLVKGYLKADQEINEQTLQVTYKISEGSPGTNVMVLTAEMRVDQYKKINKGELAERLRGARLEQFHELMKEYPFLAKAQFSLWPFWLGRVPQDSSRVNIDVNLDSW